MCIALAFSCQRTANDTVPPKTQSPSVPMRTAEMRVGSAAFHLEIGSVYERYGDGKSAIEHLAQAASLAESTAQRVQAYSALGRVKEAAGDRDGAIDALEQALAKMGDPGGSEPAAGSGLALPLAGPAGNDVLLRLAHLNAAKGNDERARLVCERGLSVAREPWQREQLYRFLIELDRKTGILEKELAAKEKTLDDAVPDESALRFLAFALAGDGMNASAIINRTQGEQEAVSKTLVRVYERLYELHPDDLQVRQTLQSLLERSGRIEDAAMLAARPAPLTPMECEVQPRRSMTLRSAGDAVRVRVVAGQKEKALAETGKIAGLAKQEGVAAYIATAELYLEQGAADRATEMFDRAVRESRSREDRRQVAFARERALERAGQAADVRVIREQWKKSDDSCLRIAATWREQLAGTAPMPSPPDPGR